MKQPFNPTRILVPCDFSRHSRAALEAARLWANAFDSTVNALYVVEEDASADKNADTSSASIQEYYEKHSGEASVKLKDLARSELRGVTSETAVRTGHPAVEILAEAKAFGARLIIMPSRGLTVLDRLATGSVAERVIQGARCPVLVTGRNRF